MAIPSMQHLPDHRPFEGEHDELLGMHELDTTKPCFMCWCYACGGRTDEPRIEHTNDAHPGDPNHRWCFE